MRTVDRCEQSSQKLSNTKINENHTNTSREIDTLTAVTPAMMSRWKIHQQFLTVHPKISNAGHNSSKNVKN